VNHASRSTRFIASALAALVLGTVIVGVAALSADDTQLARARPVTYSDDTKTENPGTLTHPPPPVIPPPPMVPPRRSLCRCSRHRWST
jgi:hypothetical protein